MELFETKNHQENSNQKSSECRDNTKELDDYLKKMERNFVIDSNNEPNNSKIIHFPNPVNSDNKSNQENIMKKLQQNHTIKFSRSQTKKNTNI